MVIKKLTVEVRKQTGELSMATSVTVEPHGAAPDGVELRRLVADLLQLQTSEGNVG